MFLNICALRVDVKRQNKAEGRGDCRWQHRYCEPTSCASLRVRSGSRGVKLDTLLSDPSLHYLASSRPSLKARVNMAPQTLSSSPVRPSQSIVSTSVPLHDVEPTPTELILATPPTVLKLLTLLAPIIHGLAILVQLVTWTHPSFFSSLLLLLVWWGMCLTGRLLLLYGVNGMVFVYILSQYLSSASRRSAPTPRYRSRPTTLTPAAYQSLVISSQVLAAQVHSFRTHILVPLGALFSFSPTQPGKPIPAYRTAWFTVTSYPFYLLLTYLVPLNQIFLVFGSICILWNAPFFGSLRRCLWRSAFVRWTCRVLIGILSGGKGLKKEIYRTQSGVGVAGLMKIPKKDKQVEEKPIKALVPNAISTTASPLVGEASNEDGDDLQVQFTVFENQRWWVGLDWTHALLPGERASWTDPALNPANPPASFALPAASITYTPSPTRSDPNSRLKRTTAWKWLDVEWRVLRSGSAPTPASTGSRLFGQFMSTPSIPASNGSATAVETGRNATKTSPSTTAPATIDGMDAAVGSEDGTLLPKVEGDYPVHLPVASEDSIFSHWLVDDEGWQYGDNHFEKMGPKGGLGKYTRRRAWVRRAGLVERCERVEGEQPLMTANNSSPTTSRLVSQRNSQSVEMVGLGVAQISSSGSPSRSRSDSRKGENGEVLRRRKSSNLRTPKKE